MVGLVIVKLWSFEDKNEVERLVLLYFEKKKKIYFAYFEFKHVFLFELGYINNKL